MNRIFLKKSLKKSGSHSSYLKLKTNNFFNGYATSEDEDEDENK